MQKKFEMADQTEHPGEHGPVFICVLGECGQMVDTEKKKGKINVHT